MKNFLYLLFYIIFLPVALKGQEYSYPKGVYYSLDEIRAKKPSEQLDLEVKYRTNADVKMNGGNDYKLVSPDKTFKKRFLKKEVLAYSEGDTLYLNCLLYKLQPWYTAVIGDGRYITFLAGASQNSRMYQDQIAATVAFGAVGGAIAGAHLAVMRFPYALDTETNQLTTLNENTLRELLANEPELLDKFEQEPDKNDPDLPFKYMEMLNKRLAE